MKTTTESPMRLLFAGGCHVVGYPVGAERSLAAVTRHVLAQRGIDTDARYLSYLKLTQRARIAAECAAARPDVIILQLGHFELSRRLSGHLREKFGRSAKPLSASKSLTPARFVAHPTIFYWKAACKALADRLLGHPLVDLRAFEEDLRSLASSLAGRPRVVLLSPLPCADPLSCHYRFAARPAFERVAAEYGFTFVDALAGAPAGRQSRFGAEDLYFDAIHLGALGHIRVGHSVAAAVAAIYANQAMESRL